MFLTTRLMNFSSRRFCCLTCAITIVFTAAMLLQLRSQQNLRHCRREMADATNRTLMTGITNDTFIAGLETRKLIAGETSGVVPSFSDAPQGSKAPLAARRDRVLCWVATSPSTLGTRGAAVNSTWLRRCDTQLFMSSESFANDSRVIKVVSSEGRENLPNKTMNAFKYLFDHYLNQSDWFMKADDTFVFVENLKYTLAAFDPDEPLYFGHHFKPHITSGYNSGGAGYVLSREALRRFGVSGYDRNVACSILSPDEDVEMGRCMEQLGVRLASTYDAAGRSRFHGYHPNSHIGGQPLLIYDYYDAHGGKLGPDSVSDYAVTFHYLTPEEILTVEYFAYRFKTFGDRIPVGDRNTSEG